MPGVALSGRPGLTLSQHAFILETSLSKPTELRLARPAVTALLPARAGGSVPWSIKTSPSTRFARSGQARLKHLLAAPVRPGATNKIDQGRSLSLRAPQGCLRVWVRQPKPVLREQAAPRPTTWILPGPRQYTDAAELTSSRLPTIHLSKSLLLKSYAISPYGFVTLNFFCPVGRRNLRRPGRGRRNHIVRSASVNRLPRRFSSNLRGVLIDT